MPAFRPSFSMAILVSVKAVLRCQDFRKEFDADTAYGDFFLGGGFLFTWTRRISAPASAKARAIARPIPRVPPVIKAVCPSSENIDGRAQDDMLSKRFGIDIDT